MPGMTEDIEDAAKCREIAAAVEKRFDIPPTIAAAIVEDIEDAIYDGTTGAATVLTDLCQQYGADLDPDLDLGRVMTFVAARYDRAVDLD